MKIVPEQIDARTVSYNFICDECCSSTYFDYADREEAIEAWNNRATEAEIRAKVITAMSKAMKEYYPACKGAYVDFDVYFHAVMAKVAEQLKEE